MSRWGWVFHGGIIALALYFLIVPGWVGIAFLLLLAGYGISMAGHFGTPHRGTSTAALWSRWTSRLRRHD